jgi:thioredoxin family protein
MRDRYLQAPDFRQYLATVQKNEALWHGVHDRVQIAPEITEAARAIPHKWHLLALSEDWCGDAVNTLPVISALVDVVPNLDLRVLSRDENLDLMDAHLTGGKSRSVPVVMVLDEDFQERGWWGPRPGPLQEWVVTEGLAMESGDRYKEARKYYARDKGRTTLGELLGLMTEAEIAV